MSVATVRTQISRALAHKSAGLWCWRAAIARSAPTSEKISRPPHPSLRHFQKCSHPAKCGGHRVRLATAVSGLVLDCVRDKVETSFSQKCVLMRLVEVDAAVVSIYPQDLSLTWGSVAVMRAAARARIPRQTNTTVRQQVQASHGASLAPPGSYKSTKLCCVIQAVCWLLCFRRVPYVAMGRLYDT